MTANVSLYLDRLIHRERSVKPRLDSLLDELSEVIVGMGYIDIITLPACIERMIASLGELGVATSTVTLWCNCTEESRRTLGCPHGNGGPRYSGGFFSEMCEAEPFDAVEEGVALPVSVEDIHGFVARCNAMTLEYALYGLRHRPEYSPCLVPGFWLLVPDDWRNVHRSNVNQSNR